MPESPFREEQPVGESPSIQQNEASKTEAVDRIVDIIGKSHSETFRNQLRYSWISQNWYSLNRCSIAYLNIKHSFLRLKSNAFEEYKTPPSQKVNNGSSGSSHPVPSESNQGESSNPEAPSVEPSPAQSDKISSKILKYKENQGYSVAKAIGKF